MHNAGRLRRFASGAQGGNGYAEQNDAIEGIEGKVKGILFKPEMVREILSGAKTQTRRLVKLQSRMEVAMKYHESHPLRSWDECDGPRPKYRVGEVVYVKEGWARNSNQLSDIQSDTSIAYRIDGVPALDNGSEIPWKSAMFMPESAARTFLEITAVRVERLQDISEEDAKAEGCEKEYEDLNPVRHGSDEQTGYFPPMYYVSAYERLWNRINKPPHDWDANPWVFVYTFKRVQP